VPRHLVENVVRDDHDVVSIDDLQQSLAEPVRGEARQQHVRVEDQPHETALKRSSSVTNP
jgi:Trk K+ transport system NAD-binding subunit